MSHSLRDQLLKQGLVSKQQAKQAEKQIKSKTHQEQKQKRKKQNKPDSKPATDTESVAYLAAKAREAEIARAKELNRQKEMERQQKALLGQIHDLIQCHYVNDQTADSTYYFVDAPFVKKVLVTTKQRQQLAKGQLAISALDEKYYLVPADIAEKILERVPTAIICFHKEQNEVKQKDELYLDYPVPDDLIW